MAEILQISECHSRAKEALKPGFQTAFFPSFVAVDKRGSPSQGRNHSAPETTRKKRNSPPSRSNKKTDCQENSSPIRKHLDKAKPAEKDNISFSAGNYYSVDPGIIPVFCLFSSAVFPGPQHKSVQHFRSFDKRNDRVRSLRAGG